MAQITYANKSTMNSNSSIPATNKCQASDMNEIKSVVNNNYNEVGDITNLTTTDKTSVVNAINENESDINTLKNGGDWTSISSNWGTLYYRYITDKVVHVIGDIAPGGTARTITMPFSTTTSNAWLLAGGGTYYTKAYMNNTNGLTIAAGTNNSTTYSVNIYIDTK